MQLRQQGTMQPLWLTMWTAITARHPWSQGVQPALAAQTRIPGTRRTAMRTTLLWTLALGLGLTMTTRSLARSAVEDSVAHIPMAWADVDSHNDSGTHAARGNMRFGVPAPSCPVKFRTIGGNQLCISSSPKSATTFPAAVAECKLSRARVATYADLFTVYVFTDLEATYNPLGRWIGPELVGDDQALCGNQAVTSGTDPDITNFEGICNKSDSREYWCVRDLQ